MTTGVNSASASFNFNNTTISRRLSDGNPRTNQNNSAFRVAGNGMPSALLRARQGDVTLNEGILQLSLHGSFMSFMSSGIVASSENMEDYTQFGNGMLTNMTDTARRMFFSDYHGDGEYSVRSLEEMALLFDDRIAALRNATGISEQRREMEIEALTLGFVMAVEMRLIGTTGAGMDFGTDSRFSTRDSIGQFALDSAMEILRTGASEETQNLLFQGLSNVVDRQSRIIAGQELEEAVNRFLKTRFVNAEEKAQTWQGVLDFQEVLNTQQQSFNRLLVALLEDMNSIRGNAQSEISAKMFTRSQNMFRQLGGAVES